MAKEIVIDLKLDSRDYKKEMKNVDSKTDGFVKGLNDKLANVSIPTGALTAAVGGITAGISLLVKEASRLEDATSQFETLTGSVAEAEKHVKDLAQFTANTPFQLDGVATASKTLQAFGVQTDDVIGILGQLGDIAAVSGSELSSLARIFGQARSDGRLMTEDLNQLTTAGIPIFAQLATQMGLTTAEVRKFASEGKISFNEFTEALNSLTGPTGQFFEGAIRKSKTLSGVLSTLKDNIALTAAEMGKELLPQVKAAALGLQAFIAENKADIVEGFRDAISALTTAVSGVTSVIAFLVDSGLDQFLIDAGKAFIAYKGAVIGAAIAQRAFNTAVKANPLVLVATAVGSLGIAFKQAIDDTKDLTDAFELFKNRALVAFGNLVTKVIPLAGAFRKLWAGIGFAVDKVVLKVLNSGLVKAITGTLQSVLLSVADFFLKLGRKFAAAGFPKMASKIGGLGNNLLKIRAKLVAVENGTDNLEKASERYQKRLKGIDEDTKKQIKSIKEAIKATKKLNEELAVKKPSKTKTGGGSASAPSTPSGGGTSVVDTEEIKTQLSFFEVSQQALTDLETREVAKRVAIRQSAQEEWFQVLKQGLGEEEAAEITLQAAILQAAGKEAEAKELLQKGIVKSRKASTERQLQDEKNLKESTVKLADSAFTAISQLAGMRISNIQDALNEELAAAEAVHAAKMEVAQEEHDAEVALLEEGLQKQLEADKEEVESLKDKNAEKLEAARELKDSQLELIAEQHEEELILLQERQDREKGIMDESLKAEQERLKALEFARNADLKAIQDKLAIAVGAEKKALEEALALRLANDKAGLDNAIVTSKLSIENKKKEIDTKVTEDKKEKDQLKATHKQHTEDVKKAEEAKVDAVIDSNEALLQALLDKNDKEKQDTEDMIDGLKTAFERFSEDEIDAKDRAEKEKKKIAQREAREAFRIQQSVQLLQATMAGALAVTRAFSDLGPIAGAVAAGAIGITTGAQIALIANQKPPKFQNGGIVAGTQAVGDTITARVNAGEMIINKSQQQNLFEQLRTGNFAGGSSEMVVERLDRLEAAILNNQPVIEMDGVKVARAVRDATQSGFRI